MIKKLQVFFQNISIFFSIQPNTEIIKDIEIKLLRKKVLEKFSFQGMEYVEM
jgi:hypothetical protein